MTADTRRAAPPGAGRAGAVTLAPRRFTALDAAMLGSLALLVALHVGAAALGAGWATAAATVGLTALALVAIAWRRVWRPLIARLLLFGLVAGLLELFTDYSGEVIARSLVYPPNEPMLWASPLYMPLSWMVTLTQIGYLAWRLDSLAPRPPRWAAIILTGLWGALNIPFYEEMAYHAGWWRYVAAPGLSLGHTPHYVILFEGLVAAALPPLLARLETRGWRSVALRGVALGVWTPWAALFAWLLIGR
jgi:uncharacterized protein DUF6989